ncbi:Uncharacterised protein [Legionella israelensis]|nr:Uncharacterised protein [Legionella israelensis]
MLLYYDIYIYGIYWLSNNVPQLARLINKPKALH